MTKPWPKVSLGELLRRERRPVKVEPERLYQEIGIYCFGRGIFHKTPRTGFEVGAKDLFLMKEGDFILQVTFAWEGAIAIVSAAEEGMYGSIRYPTFRVDESRCVPQFLLNYFKTEEGVQQLVKICPGSAGRNRVLSIRRIPEVLVPLPPLTEQRRVMARIEELADQIHEARTLRHQAVEEAEALTRKAVDALLANCRAPRKPLRELLSEPLMNGLSVPSSRLGSGVCFAKVGVVNTGEFNPRETKLVDMNLPPDSRYWLKKGDIVVSRGNSAEFVGRAAVYRGEPPKCAMPDLLIRVRLDSKKTDVHFVSAFFYSSEARDYIASQISGTSSTMPKISQPKLEAMPIAVPPLPEQRRIVSELDALQAEVDALKRLQDESAAELDACSPPSSTAPSKAIVKTGFTGCTGWQGRRQPLWKFILKILSILSASCRFMNHNKLNQPLVFMLVAGLVLAGIAGQAAETKPADKPAFPADLPGKGLAQHDFFYAGEAKTRDMYIVRAGQVAWSYHDPGGKGEISDAVLLSNGNILFAHQFGVTLITPDKKVLWKYDAPPQCETHTAQPIGTNYVIFIQNGPEPKLFVANLATGRMERELPLPAANPKSTHGQFRHARLTDAGTYLVAHMDMRKVIEYDETGKQAWSADVPGAWSAVRLMNGNTLVCGKVVLEINPKGETVWEFTSADVPDYKFDSMQIATRLPNGNTLINSWVNQWAGRIDPDTAPAQALEITPGKKVVWALRSWANPDLGPSTTIQLLDTTVAPENVHFGSIK